MRRLAWLFVLLPACGSGSPPAAARAPAAAPSARAATPSRVDPAACAEARRATAAADAPACSLPAGVFGRCDASGWISRLDEVDDGNTRRDTPDATMPCLVRWTLRHSGAELALSASTRFGVDAIPVDLRFADVDGDGAADALLTTRTEGPYGEAPRATCTVYRRGPAGIVEWKTPRGIEVTGFVDVDHDGRVDLEYGALPYQVPSVNGPPTDARGVTLVAHATPAGFAFDDDVARGVAARACAPAPRPPRADARAPLSAPELEETMRWIACSKLSGASEDAIVGALDRRCASYQGDARGSDEAGVCPGFFLDWVSQKVPRLLAPRR